MTFFSGTLSATQLNQVLELNQQLLVFVELLLYIEPSIESSRTQRRAKGCDGILIPRMSFHFLQSLYCLSLIGLSSQDPTNIKEGGLCLILFYTAHV